MKNYTLSKVGTLLESQKGPLRILIIIRGAFKNVWKTLLCGYLSGGFEFEKRSFTEIFLQQHQKTIQRGEVLWYPCRE